MEPETQSAGAQIQTLFDKLLAFGNSLMMPSRLTQMGIMIGLLIVAYLVKLYFGPKFRDWMHGLTGRPKWQLRILVMLHRRMRLIAFVILIWSVIAFMRHGLGLFPSRTYLLAIVGTISLTWLLIVFAARFIHNNFLRRMVTWGAWIYATLYFLNLTTAAEQLLDQVAVDLGGLHLSLLVVIKGLVVTALLFTLARLISSGTTKRIRGNKEISPSMQVLMVKFMQVILYGAAFFIGLKAVGFDLTGLAVLSGAIGIGLGFGLQKVVSNLVSGIIILLDKSIKPGDVISLGDTFGWINTLGARYASVVTRNGKEFLIPNEDLITNQVVNWSHTNDFVRLDIHFGTAYSDDPHLVRKLACDAAASVDRVLAMRPPVCHIVGFGDSSVDYILRFWITDPTGGLTNIRGNVFLALWDTFKENDISIPFPQREVKLLEEPAK
ncbi:mechanosensitive ion channel family protein [Profundibacter amoris]|uniref:Mechanosensitive ion channel family protein n=1 Tax=Profundibacter amoris TaxID=2171755 RepID=A0A347UCD4_9RHOB|nr:mechanosensitive ion channel family protein [Profundibacter amoris]